MEHLPASVIQVLPYTLIGAIIVIILMMIAIYTLHNENQNLRITVHYLSGVIRIFKTPFTYDKTVAQYMVKWATVYIGEDPDLYQPLADALLDLLEEHNFAHEDWDEEAFTEAAVQKGIHVRSFTLIEEEEC